MDDADATHVSRIGIGLNYDEPDAPPSIELEVRCTHCGELHYSVPIWHVRTVVSALLRVLIDLRVPVTADGPSAPPEVVAGIRAYLDTHAPGWDQPDERTH